VSVSACKLGFVDRYAYWYRVEQGRDVTARSLKGANS
jgi:hypothetical protein